MEARGPEVRPQAEPGHRRSFLGLWRDSLPTPSTSIGVRLGAGAHRVPLPAQPHGPPQGHPIAGVRGGRLGAGLEDTRPQVHGSSSSQTGRGGNGLNVRRRVNGHTKRGPCTQWSITHP